MRYSQAQATRAALKICRIRGYRHVADVRPLPNDGGMLAILPSGMMLTITDWELRRAII